MHLQDSTEILLIRHAESAPSRAIPEADWPLSPTGVQQAQQLAEALQRWKIDAVLALIMASATPGGHVADRRTSPTEKM